MNINFQKMSLKDKYKYILAFCSEYNRLPIYNNTENNEKIMRLFITNKRNQFQRSKKNLSKELAGWEIEYLNEINKYIKTKTNKLKSILNFCKEHNRIPKLVISKEGKKELIKKSKLYTLEKNIEKFNEKEIETILAKDLISLKIHKNKGNFNQKEGEIFDEIMKYKTRNRIPRIEKIKNVLCFCIEHNRTPKQHVEDLSEKRLGEFLSTAKTLNKNNKLTQSEKELLIDISKFYSKKHK